MFAPFLHPMHMYLFALTRVWFDYEGLVQPDGEPLASKFVPRSFGVVQKISEEEHWEYWNSLSKTW